MEIPLGGYEAEVTYHINHGQRLHFYIPGMYQNMRWATYSVCSVFLYGLPVIPGDSAMAFPQVSTLKTFEGLVINQVTTLCGLIY